MATSKNDHYNHQKWEEADFPILCQTCLGDNPYIRMTKERYGKECKICNRPFTVFRWCPGAKMRFKKTEICQTCSKFKNVCQTCLLDLDYGLPVQVRDSALNVKDEIPQSEINKEYYTQNMEKQVMNADGHQPYAAISKGDHRSDVLKKLARTAPYYKRNRPHICSFWVKGECKRGEECPYRHEKPTDPEDPLADQNIKDRYYGQNDPVADKLMARAASMPKLEPPEDMSITTLYVGNLGDKIGETELRDHFYQYGEIRSISLLAKQQCAFIQFVSRTGAELAAEHCFNKLILANRKLTIKWGRAHAKMTSVTRDEEGGMKALEPVPGLPGTLPQLPKALTNNFFNLTPAVGHPPPLGVQFPIPPPPFLRPPRLPQHLHLPPVPPPCTLGPVGIHYPSQDPQRMGGHSRDT